MNECGVYTHKSPMRVHVNECGVYTHKSPMRVHVNDWGYRHESPWVLGLPWWLSGEGCACQCRRQGFHAWRRKRPHARKQLGPCAPTTEACTLWSLCSETREAAAMRSPCSSGDPAQPIKHRMKLFKNMSFKEQNQGQAPAQELGGKRLRSEGN